jgi:hypothetical protein
MKFPCRHFRSVILLLLSVGAVVNSANAGSGKCVTTPKCARTCGRPDSGSSGVPCYVRVYEEGSVAHVAAQSLASGEAVCIAPGTQIRWFTLEHSSQFTVRFVSPHPFGTTTPMTFHGGEADRPDGATATPTGCYQYSITHSIGASSASADPKVIVTSAVIEETHSKRKASKPSVGN